MGRNEQNVSQNNVITSEMGRTLQTSTVYFSRVSYLFECNANDTYVLRMTHMRVGYHGRVHYGYAVEEPGQPLLCPATRQLLYSMLTSDREWP